MPAPAATTATAPAPPAAPPEPAPAASKAAVAKDVIVLTGSPLGGVRFEHKLHVARTGNNCATCHHPSRPEKPASAPQQACSSCHMAKAAAPMKTIRQGAFHNPMAQAGTCIDCHKAENAKGKKAPVNCTDCHKQENK
ncbi:MAG: cytochrome c3 family protein [Steroidobacteraceae bacterium]